MIQTIKTVLSNLVTLFTITNSKIKMLEERISSLESITAGSIDLSDIKTRLVNLEVTDADQYQQQQEIDQLLRETNKSLEEIVNN